MSKKGSKLSVKCASRHNGVHFFDIWTSKSGPNMWCFYNVHLEMCFGPQRRALFPHLNFQKCPKLWCFVHFAFEMCFAPQRRAFFEHLNLQKCAEPVSFWHFWPGNVLHATTVRTFSTSQLLKVLRTWGVFTFFTSKRASRQNGPQLFMSHLTRRLRTSFSEVSFRPSGATNHWKSTVNRDFPTFSRTCIFFLLTFSPLWSSHFLSSPLWLFPPLLFHLSILSEILLLNFLR